MGTAQGIATPAAKGNTETAPAAVLRRWIEQLGASLLWNRSQHMSASRRLLLECWRTPSGAECITEIEYTREDLRREFWKPRGWRVFAHVAETPADLDKLAAVYAGHQKQTSPMRLARAVGEETHAQEHARLDAEEDAANRRAGAPLSPLALGPGGEFVTHPLGGTLDVTEGSR